MSLAGLKKQFNKANQYMSEKMGGAEATKLTVDFVDMERKTDVTVELVDDLIVKTKEYLQPNPASRAKLMAVSKISKLSGQAKSSAYPQPEGVLGESMVKFGRALGEDGPFAVALIETGETMKQMADLKYALEDNVKQNFLEPLHHLQTKDLKDVMHHRKKLHGRRLDYDCKKRKQIKGGHVTDEEIRAAEDKFDESLYLAQMGMHNLLENDVEQISQLVALAEALQEYHKLCADVLQSVSERLAEAKNEAINRPRLEYVPKKLHELGIHVHDEEDGDFNGAPPPTRPHTPPRLLDLLITHRLVLQFIPQIIRKFLSFLDPMVVTLVLLNTKYSILFFLAARTI
uniref:BAR domain-containing protein n=1 Tax=Strigamia maritima TaxID=126957 RepID=T1JL31_STRMM